MIRRAARPCFHNQIGNIAALKLVCLEARLIVWNFVPSCSNVRSKEAMHGSSSPLSALKARSANRLGTSVMAYATAVLKPLPSSRTCAIMVVGREKQAPLVLCTHFRAWLPRDGWVWTNMPLRRR